MAEIEAWKQGGPFTSAVTSLTPQIIRIKDGNVETSNHATVSLSEARNALQSVLNGTIKQGERIGDYAFSAYDKVANIVQIGCHKINLGDAAMILQRHLKAVC